MAAKETSIPFQVALVSTMLISILMYSLGAGLWVAIVTLGVGLCVAWLLEIRARRSAESTDRTP